MFRKIADVPPIKIGEVFTPPEWATFAIHHYGITQAWLSGKKIFDGCMGSGNLLFALIDDALDQGISKAELPLHNLFGVELQPYNIAHFYAQLEQYGLTIPAKNIRQGDICFSKSFVQADIIFTNPPWVSFCDLPNPYKEQLKPLYLKYKLINRVKDMLLGNTRVDFSALIMTIQAQYWLKEQGEIIAFLPLSLFTSENHQLFRMFSNTTKIPLKQFYHLTEAKVFADTAVSYGLAHFCSHDQVPQSFRLQGDDWQEEVFPLAGTLFGGHKMALNTLSMPRQGINTGGANHLFIFDYYTKINHNLAYVSNSKNSATLPRKALYPLITNANLRGDKTITRWIFLPYNNKTGSTLQPQDLEQAENRSLLAYLVQHEQTLRSRKGLILNKTMERGLFWSLFGVGSYSFAPYKVVWQAMGASNFYPVLFEGHWQVNQAMQCSISVNSRQEAEVVLAFLKQPSVKAYLLAQGNVKSKSFAQPSMVKKLFTVMPRNENRLKKKKKY